MPWRHLARVGILAALAAASGCSRAPVVTIQNQASVTLSNVVVSGSGFTHRIAWIPPGAEHRLKVRPSGESGVRLVFDAGPRRVDSGSQGYLEARGGYRVTAAVDTNLGVTISSDRRRF